VLPRVVSRVLKHIFPILVFKVNFIPSLKINVCPENKLVRVIMDILFNRRIGEVRRLRDVFRYVRDMAHVHDLVRDIVILLGTVFTASWREPLDDDVIVHIRFYRHRFTTDGEQILFYHELYTAGFQLVQSISQLDVEHLLAILFKEIEVSVLRRQKDSTENLEQMV